MFVDDDFDILKQAEIILTKKNDFEVETAVSGKEALNLYSKNDFDIIISDYKMPGMDGIELLQKIRNMNKNIPYILLTAAGDEEVAMDALNFGADRYIIKKENISKQFKILFKEIIQEIEHKKTREKLIKSEKKYKDLVKNLPVGIYKTTPDGKIIDGNAALAEIFGYSDMEELKLKDAFDLFVNPDDRNKWIETIKEKGIVENFEYKIRKPEGDIIWVEDTARAVRDENGEIDHFNGIIRDITEIKEMEEELGQSKEWLSLTFNILNSFEDSIITTDSKGRIAFVNNSTERLFKIQKNEVIGDDFKKHFKLYKRKDKKEIKNPIEKVLTEGKFFLKDDLIYLFKGDKEETVLCTGYPIKKKSGNVIGTIFTIKRYDEIPHIEKRTERDFEGMFDGLPFGIVILDYKDYKPIKYNEKALELLEYSEEELKNVSIFDWSLDDNKLNYKNVNNSLENSGNFSTKIEKDYVNGQRKVLSFEMKRKKDDPGQNIVLSIQDITEEINQIERINKKSRKYRKAYNFIDECVVFAKLLYDNRGNIHDLIILDANSSFQEMMGVERNEMIGKRWSNIFFRLEREDLKIVDKAVRTGGQKSFKLVDNKTHNKIDVKVVSEDNDRVILIFKKPYS